MHLRPVGKLISVLLIGVCLSTSYAKVNSKIKCTEDTMRVEIPTSPDIRAIYLEGLKDYPDKQCQASQEPNSGLHVFELSLTNIFQCGVTRMLNQITGKRVYYQRIIIETTNQQITKEILNVKCVVGTNLVSNHTVAKRNVLPAGFQEPEHLNITTTLLEKAPEPILGINVRQGGVPLSGGQLHVAPGTPLQMEIFLDKTSSPIYGLLVTHMQVTDTGNQEETIIYNGCSVDPYLFDNFNTVDGDFLTANFRAFKFPESTYVQFRGTVNVCLDKCRGIECSNGIIGYGRRKREVSTLPADPNKIFEITITSFIKVNYEDESENFEELLKNKTNKHRKLITGPDQEDADKNTVKEADMAAKQVNVGHVSSIEEVQYTAIVEETTSGCSNVDSRMWLTLVCGALALMFLH